MDQMRTPSSFKTLWSDYTEREPLSREDRQEMYKAGRCAPIGEKECVLEADRFADAYIDNEVKAVRALIKAGRKLNADQTKTAQAFGMVEMPKDDSPAAKTGFVLLEYESENGFGANVRGFGICRFHAIGSDGKFEKADIVRAGPIPLEEGIAAKAQYEELNRIGKTASKG